MPLNLSFVHIFIPITRRVHCICQKVCNR